MCFKWEKEIELPKLYSIYFKTLKSFYLKYVSNSHSNINAIMSKFDMQKNWTIWLIWGAKILLSWISKFMTMHQAIFKVCATNWLSWIYVLIPQNMQIFLAHMMYIDICIYKMYTFLKLLFLKNKLIVTSSFQLINPKNIDYYGSRFSKVLLRDEAFLKTKGNNTMHLE